MAGDGLNLDQLQQAETVLGNRIKDYEKKMRVELQLKQSAAAMAKVHTDRKSRNTAEQQVQLANQNLETLSVEVLHAISEYRGIAERLRATEKWQLQAQGAAMRGESTPPMPPPRSETAAYRMSDSQRNTTELYRPAKRTSVAVMVPPRQDSTFDVANPPPVPSKPGLSRSSTGINFASYGYSPAGAPSTMPLGFQGPSERELMERVRAQAEELSRKDIELGHLTSLLREAEEHLRRFQQHPPPLPPRNESEHQQQIASLVEQTKNLEMQLWDAEKTIADLQYNKDAEMKAPQWNAMTAERDRLAARVAELELENSNLCRSRGGTELQNESGENAEETIARLKHELVNMEEKAKVAETECQKAQRANRENSNKVTLLENQLCQEGYAQQNFDAAKMASDYKAHIQELEQQLEGLQQRNANLDAQTRHLAKLLEVSNTNLGSAASDEGLLIESLQAKLTAVENTLLTTKENAERKRNALKAALAVSQKEVAALADERLQLQNTFAASERTWTERLKAQETELETLRSQVISGSPTTKDEREIERSNQDTESQLEDMRSKLQENENELERMRTQSAQMEKSWTDASRQQMEEYESMIVNLQKKLAVLGSELEAVQTENDKLNASLSQANAYAQSASDLENMQTRHKEEMQHIVSTAASKQAALEQELSHLREVVDKLGHEKKNLELQCAAHEKEKAVIEANAIRQCSATHEMERKELEDALVDERQKTRTLEMDLSNIRQQLEGAVSKVSQLDKHLNMVKGEKEGLESEFASLRKAKDELQTSHAKEFDSVRLLLEGLRQELVRYQNENKECHTQIEELQLKLSESNSNCEHMAETTETLRKEHEELQEQYQEVQRALADQQELQKRLFEAEAVHTKGSSELSVLTTQLAALEQERHALTESLSASQREKKEQINLVTSLKQKVDQLGVRLVQAETDRDNVGRDMAALRSGIDLLRADKEALETKVSAFQRDKQAADSLLSTLSGENKQLAARGNDLQSEVKRLTAQLADVRDHEPPTPPQPSELTPPSSPKREDEGLQDLIARNMQLAIDLADKERELEELQRKLRREVEEKNILAKKFEEEAKKGTSWWG
ncbi:hypothetical protein SpCBS45565_g07820 [Spizellomyces sp. 'palustris']|nr:hypothetical protein SpCBS45565_g07820 [Spizellomyces sp. 'palustris']